MHPSHFLYSTAAWPCASLPCSECLLKTAYMSLGSCGSKSYLVQTAFAGEGDRRPGVPMDMVLALPPNPVKPLPNYQLIFCHTFFPSHTSQTCLPPSCLNILGSFPACHNDQDTTRMFSTKLFTIFQSLRRRTEWKENV